MRGVLIFVLTLICALWLSIDSFAQLRPTPRVRKQMQVGQGTVRSNRLTDEGLKLFREGKTRLAAAKFRQALRANPRNARAHALAAELALNDNRLVVARQHVAEALRIDPKNSRAHFVHARLLLKENKTLAGFEHLQKAFKFANENERGRIKKILSKVRADRPKWIGRPSQPVPGSVQEVPPAAVAPAVPGEKPALAVLPFDLQGAFSEQQDLGATVSEMLTTALINTGQYRVIERRQLDRVFEEQALGQSGALEAETAAAVGSILGVDAVVVGNLSRLASTIEADARILVSQTAEAVAAFHARGNSVNQLRAMTETLARDMTAKVQLVKQGVNKVSTTVPDTLQ